MSGCLCIADWTAAPAGGVSAPGVHLKEQQHHRQLEDEGADARYDPQARIFRTQQGLEDGHAQHDSTDPGRDQPVAGYRAQAAPQHAAKQGRSQRESDRPQEQEGPYKTPYVAVQEVGLEAEPIGDAGGKEELEKSSVERARLRLFQGATPDCQPAGGDDEEYRKVRIEEVLQGRRQLRD